MTMPQLMNCPHSDDGWCIDCVKRLWQDREDKAKENDHLKETIETMQKRINDLSKEAKYQKDLIQAVREQDRADS